MTDNELRAHDLAIASIPVMLEMSDRNALKRGEKENRFDVYKTYLDIYFSAIENFERDFPVNK